VALVAFKTHDCPLELRVSRAERPSRLTVLTKLGAQLPTATAGHAGTPDGRSTARRTPPSGYRTDSIKSADAAALPATRSADRQVVYGPVVSVA
jgi:hypothetical protein